MTDQTKFFIITGYNSTLRRAYIAKHEGRPMAFLRRKNAEANCLPHEKVWVKEFGFTSRDGEPIVMSYALMDAHGGPVIHDPFALRQAAKNRRRLEL